MSLNRQVNFDQILGSSQEYKLGQRQLKAWNTRRSRLQKCKGCGRLIDGILKRGYCIWCASMNQAAINEVKKAETAARYERLAKQRAKDAEKRARRKARKAAKEVA